MSTTQYSLSLEDAVQTGMTIAVGSNPATLLKLLDAGQAVLQIPPGAAGPTDLKVTLPDGATATLSGAPIRSRLA